MWVLAQELDPGVLIGGATAMGGFGGLWFIVRLVVRYQRDFTDSYALRIGQLEERIKVLVCR